MDSSTLRLLFVFTDLAAPLLVGYWLKTRSFWSPAANDRLIKINIRLVYTILSLLSFWVVPLRASLLLVPLFGFFLVLMPGAVGYLLFARRIESLLDRGAYIGSAMLANLGTLGGVCAFILYSEEGFAITQLVGACQNILLALIVFPLAQYYQMKASGTRRQTDRIHSFVAIFFSWNQLSLIGIVIGFLLNAYGVARPAFLSPVFQSLVHIGAWTAMLPVGYLLDTSAVRANLKKVRSLTVLRFIVCPVITYFLATAIIREPVLLGTILILSCCPTAINAVLSAQLYHLNVGLAATSFLVTTTIFIVLIFPALFFYLH